MQTIQERVDTFKVRLKERRIELKYTLQDLGRLTMLSTSTIDNYEHGYTSPTIQPLVDLCHALKCTPNYLLGF